jgi:hypothetical protein
MGKSVVNSVVNKWKNGGNSGELGRTPRNSKTRYWSGFHCSFNVLN